MYKRTVNLYNTLVAIYFNEFNNITDEEKEEMDKKCDLRNLLLKGHKYDEWYKKR